MADRLRGVRSNLNGGFYEKQLIHRAKSEVIHLIDDAGSLTLSDISDVTATAAEVNTLDGITATVGELNILDGVTATAAEINTLDGITASTSELNLLDLSGLTIDDVLSADGPAAASWKPQT